MKPRLIWANLASTDLDRTTQFYTALGFKFNGKENDLTSFEFGNTNFIINFFTETKLQEESNGKITKPKNENEILFSLSADSKEEVDGWVEKIKAAGGTIFSKAQNYQKGYTLGFADPDGHKFNILYWPGM